MNFDIRSEMALNLIINMNLGLEPSLKRLAMICRRWGMSAQESCPLAKELTLRMGYTEKQGIDVMRSAIQAGRN